MGDWFDENMGWIVSLVVVVVVGGIIALGATASSNSYNKWEAFKAEHKCRITGRMDGSTDLGIGFSSSGSLVTTTTSTPDRTGWTCDDGITYWK